MTFGILGNILGVTVGFIAVMLLLSLVVTGLTSAAKSLMRLPARSARAGLVQHLNLDLGLDQPQARELAWQHLGDFADHQRSQPLLVALLRLLLGPRRELVDPKALTELLKDQTPPCDLAQPVSAESLANRASDNLTLTMRWLSVAAALLVAGGFQVNATELLGDLTIDTTLRAKTVELATELAKRDPPNDPLQSTSPDRISTQLLAQKKLIELTDGKLGRIDIQFWGKGWAYYTKPLPSPSGQTRFPFSHLFGVLTTTLLISFGAPFWYQQLKKLGALKSSLLSPTRTEMEGKAS